MDAGISTRLARTLSSSAAGQCQHAIKCRIDELGEAPAGGFHDLGRSTPVVPENGTATDCRAAAPLPGDYRHQGTLAQGGLTHGVSSIHRVKLAAPPNRRPVQPLVAVHLELVVPAQDDASVSVNVNVPDADVDDTKFPTTDETLFVTEYVKALLLMMTVVDCSTVPSAVHVPLPKKF